MEGTWVMKPHWKDVLYEAIHLERVRAHAKHMESGSSMEGREPLDPLWLPVLVEEVGEVARSLCDKEGLDRLREELIQVAAMAASWIDSVDCELERIGF